MHTRKVIDYRTGKDLAGQATQGLRRASWAAGATGAVNARCDRGRWWHFVRPEDVDALKARGETVHVVYVE